MYSNLIQTLSQVIQNVNDLQGAKLFYNLIKSDSSSSEKRTLKDAESLLSPHLDFFSKSRTMFTQWIIQSDIYLEKFTKDNFLKRFLKQRDKVQNEFDKQKPNATKLTSYLNELYVHLQALEQYGKPKLKKLEKITKPQKSDIIVLEKGKPYDALRQVSEIFQAAKGFIKVMDKYLSERTLDFFVSTSDVPIQILTSNISSKNKTQFFILYRRLLEEKGNKIEIRKVNSDEFHDRYILTQDESWIIGPSLKDAGYKNWGTISLLKDDKKKKKIEIMFDKLWKTSNSLNESQ